MNSFKRLVTEDETSALNGPNKVISFTTTLVQHVGGHTPATSVLSGTSVTSITRHGGTHNGPYGERQPLSGRAPFHRLS